MRVAHGNGLRQLSSRKEKLLKWLVACCSRQLSLLLLCAFATGAMAALPVPPKIAAKAYLLVDVQANQVLAEENADALADQASLTKLMTAFLVFEALEQQRLSMQQELLVSKHAWEIGKQGSSMFLNAGAKVPVEDLLKGLIVQSGNDAAVVLAEGVAGTVEQFVVQMNAKARELGLHNTHYRNPEGFTDDAHKTTARDLAKLAMHLMRTFPQYMHYYAMQSYRYPGTPPKNSDNRNLLLKRDPSVDGLKTGYTAAAGYCLIATARRDINGFGQRRLISVVLGAKSKLARADESQRLLNWGYTAYQPVVLFKANQAATTVQVWKGKENEAALGQFNDIVAAVPSATLDRVRVTVSKPEQVIAPLLKGQNVASMQVSVDGEVVTERTLLALNDVPEAGWFGRMWDSFKLWLQ